MNARLWMSAALAAVVAISPASAQERQRPQRGGGGANLLANPKVLEALKLSDEQKTKVKELLPDPAERAKLQDLPENERREKMRELFTKARENAQKVEELLTDAQKNRLKQIGLQANFPRSLSQEEVANALKLTDDQKTKIREAQQGGRELLAKLREGGNNREALEKLAAFRKESNEKVLAVLTDEQKKAWKELTGDPVEIAPAAGFGGPGRFGAGRPGEGTPRRRPNRDTK